ncbi:hypothetical protein [Luteimonas sp. TWI662]|uniref:hypothetical protein n=1 Tax=unclassified Luteimonas TaxID=2629088 RepID=UPI00320801FE
MQPDVPQADYDWLLHWTAWSLREDRRLEAAFPLDEFLQRSGAAPLTWSLDFLSWKCERLARDRCWYELRVERLPQGTRVRVLLDR